MAAKYQHIATITLDSSASSVTFSSIPQGYRDLELVIDTPSSNPVSVLRYNGSTTNYSRIVMEGTGSGTNSGTSSSNNIAALAGPSLNIIQIMDYSATDKQKTNLLRANGSEARADAQRWADTSAITSVSIVAFTGSLLTGTTFDLYGIVGGA